MREEMEREGNWLFRWRSFLPLLMIGMVVAALPSIDHSCHSERSHCVWEGVSLLICLLGLAVRIVAIGHAAKCTSGRNTKKQVADCLNTTGIYSLVRHPLYLGNYLIWIGLTVFIHTWWLTLICTLAFWLYYERIMFAEEEFLRGKFGDEYLEWAGRTPAFLPGVSGYLKPINPFSGRVVVRREVDGFYAIVVVATLLELVSDLTQKHHLEVDRFWLILFLGGTLIWATIKFLKKRTQVLAGG